MYIFVHLMKKPAHQKIIGVIKQTYVFIIRKRPLT